MVIRDAGAVRRCDRGSYTYHGYTTNYGHTYYYGYLAMALVLCADATEV